MSLVQDGKESTLLDEHFQAAGLLGGGDVHESSFNVLVEPKKAGFRDGKATLNIMVRDFSWWGWFHGNRSMIEKEILIDTKPPRIEVLTRQHNISQGGAGLIIYRLAESCSVSGVNVGDRFYPGYTGYFEDQHIYMAFFALDFSQGRKTQILVRAVDGAGNEATAGFYHHIRKKRFKSDVINISDRFLNAKIPEFAALFPEESANQPLDTAIDKFKWINNDLRRQSYLKLQAICSQTDPSINWTGTFLRLPNSKRMAGFADARDYTYQGRVIDHQVHMGIDLAAYSHDSVPAANNGVVVFDDYLGIYGKTVVIDHGFGLFSIYAHLNQINVQHNQRVEKGTPLGRTGKTGLAGGDHLHFGMIIHQTYVNPIEWWDNAWITNNITSKIQLVQSEYSHAKKTQNQ